MRVGSVKNGDIKINVYCCTVCHANCVIILCILSGDLGHQLSCQHCQATFEDSIGSPPKPKYFILMLQKKNYCFNYALTECVEPPEVAF